MKKVLSINKKLKMNTSVFENRTKRPHSAIDRLELNFLANCNELTNTFCDKKKKSVQ